MTLTKLRRHSYPRRSVQVEAFLQGVDHLLLCTVRWLRSLLRKAKLVQVFVALLAVGARLILLVL